MTFADATRRYETWLAAAAGPLVPADIAAAAESLADALEAD